MLDKQIQYDIHTLHILQQQKHNSLEMFSKQYYFMVYREIKTSLLQAKSTMLTKTLCSLASLNKNLSHQKKIMSTKSYYK
jgi:hypothetical protein